ncbi:hypothetical protein E8L99_22040 [Phreatobacter aquaticus]|uniref:Uncharacterized protein n=1 Tax=Phreatobacter aquaticus TaxID=2570229 RepID=A0A4D7QKT8_9HYPH|nr:hypothetical protein [Phreatobacter aquaticus]QCK88248.1 hypothetical protein E8L99_22040 [Phreatobacter aquaticus]
MMVVIVKAPMEDSMSPLLVGTVIAVALAASYALLRRAVLQAHQPVRAEIQVRRLRRDPVTGEYRPM